MYEFGYGFEEGSGAVAIDSSGKGNNGTIVNDPLRVAGKYGECLQYDLTKQVGVISPINDAFPDITTMCWIYMPHLPESSDNVGETAISYFSNWNIWWDHNTYPGTIELRVNNIRMRTSFGAVANEWMHIAATYEAAIGTLIVYNNGVEYDREDRYANMPINSTTDNWRIGHHFNGRHFDDGLIDEVRLYSSVLSQSEIQTLMNTPVVAPPTPSLPKGGLGLLGVGQ